MTSGRRAVALATLSVVLAAFCWGLSAVFAVGAFERGITPERLAEARAAVAGIPLLTYLALGRRDLLRPPRTSLVPIVVFGIGLVAVNWAYYTAIDRLQVGVAISLQYTAPVLILVLAAVIGRSLPAILVWAASLFTLAGAVLVSGAYAGLADLDGLGVAAGAASAIAFAVYLLSAEAAGRRGAQPATVLVIGFVVAGVVWGIALPWWSWPVDRLGDPQVLLRVLGVGLVGTLFPFLLAVSALRVISAAVAGIAATAEPVFAAGLAWLLLGQALGGPQLIGGGMVVIGVLLAQVARGATGGRAMVGEAAAASGAS